MALLNLTTPDLSKANQLQIKPEDTVSGRVADITRKDAPLMQLAATGAKQEMNKRGLLSSSQAIGAGRKAVTEKALEIARPEAEMAFAAKAKEYDRGTAAQKIEGQSRLQREASEQRLGSMSKEAELQKDMTNFEAGVKERLASVEQGYVLELEELKNEAKLTESRNDAVSKMYDAGLRSMAAVLEKKDLTGQGLKNRIEVLKNNMIASVRFASGLRDTENPILATAWGESYGESYGDRAAREKRDAEVQAQADLEAQQERDEKARDLTVRERYLAGEYGGDVDSGGNLRYDAYKGRAISDELKERALRKGYDV